MCGCNCCPCLTTGWWWNSNRNFTCQPCYSTMHHAWATQSCLFFFNEHASSFASLNNIVQLYINWLPTEDYDIQYTCDLTVHRRSWYLMRSLTMWEVLVAMATSSKVCLEGSLMNRLGAITMATLVRSILLVVECWVTFSKNWSNR